MVHVEWIVVRGVGDGWGWIAGRDTLAAVMESRVRETGTGWEVVEQCEKGAPRSEPIVCHTCGRFFNSGFVLFHGPHGHGCENKMTTVKALK